MMKQVDEQVTKTSACFGPLPHFVGCMIGNSNKKLHIQKRPTVKRRLSLRLSLLPLQKRNSSGSFDNEMLFPGLFPCDFV